MSKLIFIDFETFGMPGSPELIWQFAYGHMDTTQPKYWENVDYFSGIIDWSDRDFKCVSPSSHDFTMKYTPDAFDWVTGKKESPYKLYTLEEFSEATVEWFRGHGCYPGGEGEDWSMVGRNPEFDYYCFPKEVRQKISLTPFKCQDFALMYSAMCRKPNRKGRLPSLDHIKDAAQIDGTLTHHDALLDVKDEIRLTLEAWLGVNTHWKNKINGKKER